MPYRQAFKTQTPETRRVSSVDITYSSLADQVKVVAKGHTVFLGWGSRCAQTLRDFAEVSDGERVVVLAAGEERDALVGELREVLGSDKRKRLKLHYREGVVSQSVAYALRASPTRGVVLTLSCRSRVFRAP